MTATPRTSPRLESEGALEIKSRAGVSSAPPAVRHCRKRRRAAPLLDSFRKVPQRTDRPPADEASLAAGDWLGLDPYPITPEMAARYLADSHESAAIYREQGLVHPRDILRGGNFVISRNVVLGPWVHTGSASAISPR